MFDIYTSAHRKAFGWLLLLYSRKCSIHTHTYECYVEIHLINLLIRFHGFFFLCIFISLQITCTFAPRCVCSSASSFVGSPPCHSSFFPPVYAFPLIQLANNLQSLLLQYQWHPHEVSAWCGCRAQPRSVPRYTIQVLEHSNASAIGMLFICGVHHTTHPHSRQCTHPKDGIVGGRICNVYMLSLVNPFRFSLHFRYFHTTFNIYRARGGGESKSLHSGSHAPASCSAWKVNQRNGYYAY